MHVVIYPCCTGWLFLEKSLYDLRLIGCWHWRDLLIAWCSACSWCQSTVCYLRSVGLYNKVLTYGVPSTRTCVNYHTKLIFWWTVFLSIIWLFLFVSSYIWNLSRVSINFPFLVMYRMSIISCMGRNVWLLWMKCCAKLDLPFLYL